MSNMLAYIKNIENLNLSIVLILKMSLIWIVCSIMGEVKYFKGTKFINFSVENMTDLNQIIYDCYCLEYLD